MSLKTTFPDEDEEELSQLLAKAHEQEDKHIQY